MGGFADNVRIMRLNRGWTQAELADRLGMTSQAITIWERGHSVPRPSTLQQVASIFGVSVDALLGDERITPAPSSALVPVLGTAHMGGYDDIDEVDYRVEVPASVVERHPRGFLIHGFGPCMNRRFPEDAHLLIDPDMLPKSGDAVLVQRDGQALVRSYMRGASTVMLSPDSYSEDLQDMIGSPDDPPAKLVGVVVWYQASEDVRRA